LLEVGTGFHPELTGRENVYLNGAILGMKKVEIDRKFDKIVAFAEIEKFIDTPVKHYSSGMYVRLAFSVAAHLEPEILLVDEVLAVGDVAFQRKCLGKMDDVAQQGRTVLFVSHNMGLMQTLCERGIVLQEGAIFMDGTITAAVDSYLQTLEKANIQDPIERTDRKGMGKVKLIDVEICGDHNGLRGSVRTGQPARFVFRVDNSVPGMNCSFFLFDHVGQRVTAFKSKYPGPRDARDPSIGHSFVCEMDELLLVPGRYRVDVAIIGDNRLQDYIEAATMLDVGPGLLDGRPVESEWKVSMIMPHRWTLPTDRSDSANEE
jgi:lipopolysaccharide transport system ATP-binding protein